MLPQDRGGVSPWVSRGIDFSFFLVVTKLLPISRDLGNRWLVASFLPEP